MNSSTSPRVAASSHLNNDSLHRTQTFAARFRSLGVMLAVAVICSIVLLPLTSSAQTTWNNSGTEWTSGTSWVGGVAPASSVSATTNTAVFSNVAVGFNAVNLSSERSIYGVLFTAGANAYTFTGNALTVGNGGGISNASASLQTFNNKVINNGSGPVYGSYAGGSLLFAGGIDLTPSNSSASRTVAFLGSGAVTVSGAIAAGGTSTGGNLIFGNAALNTLSGNNTYFGTTTVSNGSTLRLGSATALGATAGGTEIKSGGALDLNGQTIGAEALAINGTGVSSSGVIFNSSASAATWSGAITPSAGSTIKATSGSITLSGGIDLNNNSDSSRTLTLDGTGEIIVSGNISNSFAGSTGSLTKTGSGTVTLSGANTYSGTTEISAGTLLLSGTSALFTNGVIAGSSSSSNNSKLQLAGGGNYVLSAFGSTNKNGGNIDFTNSSGSAATLTFTAATNYVTRSSDNAGGRTVANQSTNLGVVFNGAVDIGSTNSNNVTFGGAGNTTVKGVIFNTNTAVVRGLTKTGIGILSLEGANSYNGPTTVSAGSLIIDGNQSSAIGSLNVAAGATLGGSGTIGGVTTISGVLSPGKSSIDTLTVNNDVTWNGGENWVFELGTAGLQPGSPGTSDLLALTGAGRFLKGTGTSWIFDFSNTGDLGWYKLAEWTGGSTTFDSLNFQGTNLAGGYTGQFDIQGDALYVQVVPEPSTYALLGVSALACGAWFVRRRRKS
jgi:autotransporter-associated beta strand protein